MYTKKKKKLINYKNNKDIENENLYELNFIVYFFN